MSSSSDSELESEQRAKFKAVAVDVNQIFQLPIPTAKKSTRVQSAGIEPTSRYTAGSLQRGHDLETTPGFRSFVAAKMYESLERRIKFRSKADPGVASESTDQNKPGGDWGFRLFSFSTSNSRSDDASQKAKMKKKKKSGHNSSSSSDSDSNGKFASAVVSYETLLTESQTLNSFHAKRKRKVEEDVLEERDMEKEKTETSEKTCDKSNITNKHKKKKPSNSSAATD